MKWSMDHVCTHVPHLDLVDFDQKVFATARTNISSDPAMKKFKSVDARAP